MKIIILAKMPFLIKIQIPILILLLLHNTVFNKINLNNNFIRAVFNRIIHKMQ
jgi:hypothetical protein